MPLSRSAAESGADLMNWGRFPTTLSTFTRRSLRRQPGCASAVAVVASEVVGILDRMSPRTAVLAAWVATLALLAGVASVRSEAAPAARADVTFVGDSISASLDYVPSARRVLTRSFDTSFDLAVCRRL